MSVKFWTKEEITELKKLWGSGLTAREIGEKLGRPRNGVIGQARRSGLQKRKPRIKKEKYSLKNCKINKTIYGNPKKLIDVQRDECIWPVDTDEGLLFCCAPIKKGSYCEKHALVAYRKDHRNDRKNSVLHGK